MTNKTDNAFIAGTNTLSSEKDDTLSRLCQVMGADTFTELLVERARALDPEAWEAQANATEPDPDLDEAVNDTFQQAEEQLLEQVLQETLVEQARAHCESSFAD